jgi:hypothetical protein
LLFPSFSFFHVSRVKEWALTPFAGSLSSAPPPPPPPPMHDDAAAAASAAAAAAATAPNASAAAADSGSSAARWEREYALVDCQLEFLELMREGSPMEVGPTICRVSLATSQHAVSLDKRGSTAVNAC